MTELSTMQLHSIFGFILFFLLVWQVIHAIFSWQQYWRESSFEKLQTNKQTNVLFSAGSCASMSTLNPPFTDFILAFTNLHYLTNVVRCQLLIGKNESIIRLRLCSSAVHNYGWSHFHCFVSYMYFMCPSDKVLKSFEWLKYKNK